MNGYLLLPAIALIAVAVLIYRKTTARTPKSGPSLDDRVRNDGAEVRCFTCGDWVAREKALEKKGRYFCGVKKSERGRAASRGDAAGTTRAG